MDKGELNLLVNGKPIEMNQFATTIVRNTVLAIVQSLHLKEEPEVVQLTIKGLSTKK